MRVLDDKHIPELLPCTPRGVLKILDENGINIEGMNAVMIGRSDLVGKPLSHLLLNKSATITVCHKLTKDVNFYTQSADLVVAAAGAANLVKKVKPGAILIDVGISRDF
jgi:methylenetetrahydrofolate dehydrogenase (NADP+)/methenyltetrahydrofolate cyclohydrolase